MAVLQGFVANKCSFSWEQTVVEKKRKMEKKEQKSFNLLTFSSSPSLGLFLLLQGERRKKSGGFDGWMPNSFLFWETFVCFRFFSKGTFHLQLLYPIIPLGPISCYSMRNRIWRIYPTFLFFAFSPLLFVKQRERLRRRRGGVWSTEGQGHSLSLSYFRPPTSLFSSLSLSLSSSTSSI